MSMLPTFFSSNVPIDLMTSSRMCNIIMKTDSNSPSNILEIDFTTFYIFHTYT